jgi:hypothetical protein
MFRHVCLAVAVLVAFALSAAAQPGKLKGKPVKPDREWVDVVKDNKLAEAAPKSGILVTAKDFEKLWKAWRKDEKVPEIDFKTKVVLVTVAKGGPNKPRLSAVIDEKGNLKTTYISTLIGGPGFGYSIAVFDRKGIQTVNGQPIPKE